MGDIPTMRSIPTLAVAGILCLIPQLARGQVPPPEPTAPPAAVAPAQQPLAEEKLNGAIVSVRVMERIAARVEQDVDMLNQKFRLEGNYYKDTGHRVRLQLNLVGLGDTGSTMLQVCDGKILWEYQKVLNMQSYRKREITPILQKLEDPALDADFKILIISNMGFGGPETMLSGLKKAVLFDQISEAKLDGVDVYIIGGTWRDRSNLMGPNERPLSPTASLPPYIPSVVRVFVGKFDGWPYRIEMIGKAPLLMEDTRAIDPVTNRPIGQPRKPPKVDPSKITLTYKLLPVAEITPGLFDFAAPADVAATSVRDDTEETLARLSQYIEMATNNKKAEAARKEESGEPLLKAKPIEVGRDPLAEPPAGAPSPK